MKLLKRMDTVAKTWLWCFVEKSAWAGARFQPLSQPTSTNSQLPQPEQSKSIQMATLSS